MFASNALRGGRRVSTAPARARWGALAAPARRFRGEKGLAPAMASAAYGVPTSTPSNVAWSPMPSRPLHVHGEVPPTPAQALTYLREGTDRFRKGEVLSPNRSLDLLQATKGGQAPFAAFLSCADSRVPVEIVFDQGFGDLFVTRVAGNVVTTEITASLEFGCAVLGAKILYVLGHTACGAVTATAKGSEVPGVISSLYYHIAEATNKCEGDVEASITENVRNQVNRLHVSPVLSNLVKEGKLKIVGGVYDLGTGQVTELD
jgi:carbonic anhydrase